MAFEANDIQSGAVVRLVLLLADLTYREPCTYMMRQSSSHRMAIRMDKQRSRLLTAITYMVPVIVICIAPAIIACAIEH